MPPESPSPTSFSHPLPFSLLLSALRRVDIQAQTLGVKVQLIPTAVLLQNIGDVPCVLDTSQFDVSLALLDSVTDKLRGAGFTLGTDDGGLLLLTGLVDEESCTLGFLLSDLLCFNGGGEFGRECEVLDEGLISMGGKGLEFDLREGEWCRAYRQGNIIEQDIESSSTLRQVISDQACNIVSLGDQLTSIELCNDALQNLIDN